MYFRKIVSTVFSAMSQVIRLQYPNYFAAQVRINKKSIPSENIPRSLMQHEFNLIYKFFRAVNIMLLKCSIASVHRKRCKKADNKLLTYFRRIHSSYLFQKSFQKASRADFTCRRSIKTEIEKYVD